MVFYADKQTCDELKVCWSKQAQAVVWRDMCTPVTMWLMALKHTRMRVHTYDVAREQEAETHKYLMLYLRQKARTSLRKEQQRR